MKIGIYILIAIAVLLMIFNATKLESDNLFEGDSAVAVISILAAACAILLLIILLMSIKIDKKAK